VLIGAELGRAPFKLEWMLLNLVYLSSGVSESEAEPRVACQPFFDSLGPLQNAANVACRATLAPSFRASGAGCV